MSILSRLFVGRHVMPSLETTLARAIQGEKFAEAGKLLNKIIATARSGIGVPIDISVDATKAKDGLVWIMFAIKALEDFPLRPKQQAEETTVMLADADGEVMCSFNGILACLMAVVTFAERFPDLAVKKNFHQKVAPSVDSLASSLPKDVFTYLR